MLFFTIIFSLVGHISADTSGDVAHYYVGPLTTRFTPPAACSTLTADLAHNSPDPGYYIFGNYIWGYCPFSGVPGTYVSCCPQEWAYLVYYSPGICPSGYYACRDKTISAGETRAQCCPSAYTCPTARLNVPTNELTDHCLSTITGSTLVWDYAWLGASATASQTTATAIAIEVRWRDSDLLSFGDLQPSATWVLPSSTSLVAVTTASATHSQNSATSNAIASPTPTESGNQREAFSLGLGSKVALGLGIPLGFILIAICVYACLRFRRKKPRAKSGTSYPQRYEFQSQSRNNIENQRYGHELGQLPRCQDDLPEYVHQMKF